jgi:hypothetical protein
MQPHELELHKTQEVLFGDSKDMIHLQHIEIQAQKPQKPCHKQLA